MRVKVAQQVATHEGGSQKQVLYEEFETHDGDAVMRVALNIRIHNGGSHGAGAGRRLIPMIEVAVMWVAWNIEDP